jgi:hypothetical protein
LQVILGDAWPPALVHPQAQALVSDELDYSDGFIESSVLLLGTV